MDRRIDVNFEFADFRLDEPGHVLKKGEVIVPLEPLAFMLLRYLVQHRDRIVSKDEIISALWDGRAISDAALNTQIRNIRRALGDDREHQAFIRTYSKRGFQFVAQATVTGSTFPPEPLRTDTSRMRKFIVPALLAAIVLVTGATLYVSTLTRQPTSAIAQQRPSLAVLAFENLSNDPQQDYFSRGLTEDLVVKLSLYRELFVISYRSTRSFKKPIDDISKVSRDLGVAYVIRGSTRKVEKRLRINVQLLDGATGKTLWGTTLDRELSDIFSIQDDLAQTIAGRLAPELSKAQFTQTKDKPTNDLQAWDFYIRARAAEATLSKENQIEAINLAKRAIVLDSTFAGAHALIARANGNLYFQQWSEDPKKVLKEAILHGKLAIKFDPDDPSAYAALGYIYRFKGDEERAISNLQRAKSLNPSDAVIRLQLAHTLDWFRHQKLALPEINEALKLSPRDPLLQNMLFYKSHIQYHLRDFKGSLNTARKMSAVVSSNRWKLFHYLMKAVNLVEMGKNEEARRAIQGALEINPRLSIKGLKKLFERSKNHPENRRIWLLSLAKAGLPA